MYTFVASKEGKIHLHGNSATYKRVLHEPLAASDYDLTEEEEGMVDDGTTRSQHGRQLRGGGQRSAISSKDHSLRQFCFLIPNMKVHTELSEQYAFKDDGRPIWNLTVSPASSSADAMNDFKRLNEMIQGLIGLLHTPNTSSSSSSSSSSKGIPPVSRS